jgi:hypothetical protein
MESSNSTFNFQNPKSNQHHNKDKPKPDKLNSECRYCHKRGHWAKECRKCIADEKKKNSANVSSQELEPSFSFVASGKPAVLAGSVREIAPNPEPYVITMYIKSRG